MRLNQVTAATHDLAASIAFYQLLGLRLIVRSEHYARFELPKGEATFSLHVVEGPIPRENAPQLYFEVADVVFETRRLKHAGIAIEREPVQQDWLWHEAWLRDPAGNSICIYHAGDARRFPPWRIDADPGPKRLHLVIRDGDVWSIVKHDGGSDAWRALQDRYADYKTSLGPYDLFDLLAVIEADWPDTFLAQQDAIRAFVASDADAMEF